MSAIIATPARLRFPDGDAEGARAEAAFRDTWPRDEALAPPVGRLRWQDAWRQLMRLLDEGLRGALELFVPVTRL